MKSGLKIADNMLDLIGEIPLVRLNRLGQQSATEILVKPELLNPSGSIKDRIAKRMIEEAEAQGLLHEMCRIIEATGGNTGTALAFVSAVKGYDFVAYVPDKIADPSRVAIMLAYGCEAVSVDTDAYEAARTGDKSAAPKSGAHGGLDFDEGQFINLGENCCSHTRTTVVPWRVGNLTTTLADEVLTRDSATEAVSIEAGWRQLSPQHVNWKFLG